MKLITFLSLLAIVLQSAQLQSAGEIAKSLNLIPGTRATIQWERIFETPQKMQRYGIDALSSAQQLKLKHYLLEHAADSDQPTVPGL